MFLLFQILKATASNGSQISIPFSPTSFSPSYSNEWLNSLWFMSLTLSLLTALVTVLVKQWLHQYSAVVSDSSACDHARIQHMRYTGLQMWQVPMIIGLLPVLLHVSLALFLAGLAIFLFSLGTKVAWLVSIISTVTCMAYVIALILPLVYPYCPYKVPLTIYVHRPWQYIHHLYQYGNIYLTSYMWFCITVVRCFPYTHMFGCHCHCYLAYYLHAVKVVKWHESLERQERRESLILFPTLKEFEYKHIQECTKKVDVQSLLWLHSSTSNVLVHQSVLQAISGMTLKALRCLPGENVSAFTLSLCQQIEDIKSLVLSPGTNGESYKLELYYRALLLLCSHAIGECSAECSEQLQTVLHSMTTTEQLAFFLGILRGPKCSSLTLHSAVWKILVDATISSPPISSSALELELELMEILTGFSSASKSGDFTMIDKPTEELRRHILGKLSPNWQHNHIETPTTISSIKLHTMIAFVSSIQHRFCNSGYVWEQLIEASLAIIEQTDHLIQTLDEKEEVNTVLDVLYSLLCSKPFAVVGYLEALVHRIFMIFDNRQHPSLSLLSYNLSNIQFCSITYQCYLRSLAGSDEKLETDAILPILEHFLSSCLSMYEHHTDTCPHPT